jgi:hypothetical protein
MIQVKIDYIEEPKLQFRDGFLDEEPKRALMRAGPFGSNYHSGIKTIRLGLVGLPEEISGAKRWLDRMHSLLLENETNALRFREFPGVERAFRCRFELPDHFIRSLNKARYDRILAARSHDRFEQLLEFYSDSISSLFADQRPECVLVCFPEELATLRVSNRTLTYKERLVLERLQQEFESEQMSLFEPTEDDKRLAAELLPQADELLFRNFHRALKAKCMMLQNSIPLQVIRQHTYDSSEAKQSDATRAWNLGVAVYYKAGNLPWRPSGLPPGTCYVGVSFHHLKRRSGDIVYASVAQAFSNELEPFALKGAAIPRDQTREKQPYLTEAQSAALMSDIVTEYKRRTGSVPPSNVVVHKTSRYQKEEEDGFRKGLLSKVPACDLVWIRPTGFRLLRRGMREPDRGTLCRLGGGKNYIFTTGFVPRWDQYPGPHIPAPLEIGVSDQSKLLDRSREVLILTKMNWNSADGIGRHPITIAFARRVGSMMTEIDENCIPNPLYRFYM